MMLNIFSYVRLPSIPLWWDVCLVLLPVVHLDCLGFLLLNFIVEFELLYILLLNFIVEFELLCILDASTLSCLCFANTFTHLVACLFIFLRVSLSRAEVFNFNKVQIVNFFFQEKAFGMYIKTYCHPRSSRYFPVLFSRSYSFVFYI